MRSRSPSLSGSTRSSPTEIRLQLDWDRREISPAAAEVPLAAGWAGDRAVLISNTGANALAADTAIHRLVERSHRGYGHRFVMQDLDKVMDRVSSGILAVPVLRHRRH